MLKLFTAVIFVSASLSSFESCVTNEEGRRAYNVVPESQMNSMGSQAYSQILDDAKAKGALMAPSSAQHDVVARIGQRIAAASGVEYKWEFAVINEPKTVNAFCLPGGKIAVYTGLFPVARDEASLAAVIGHEVAHATLHHGAERMSQQLTLAGFTAAADMFTRDSKYHDIAVGALGVGAQFGVILPFSRGHESEADSLGLRYAALAGYDPEAAVGLWERMGASGKSPPEFMSTHPDPANRRQALSAKQSDVRPMFDGSEKQPDRKLPGI